MSEQNTFKEKPPFKKRLITASVTEPQFEQVEWLKKRLGLDSTGAVIKAALADLVEKESAR